MTKNSLPMLVALTLSMGCAGPTSEDPPEEILLIEDDPTPDAGPEPDASDTPDASPDVAEEDMAEEDMAEPPPEPITFTLDFEGEGEAVVEVRRDGALLDTCTTDCAFEVEPAEWLPFEVRVIETSNGGVITRFIGPCTDSSQTECTLGGGRDVTLRVVTRDYMEPNGVAFSPSGTSEGSVRAVQVDADGHAHVVAVGVAPRFVPDARPNRPYYIQMNDELEVLSSVELPGSSHVVRLDPVTGAVRIFASCRPNADVGAFRMTDAGICAWRVTEEGAIVDGVGWPGTSFEDASIGADGTIAILGNVGEDTLVGGHTITALGGSDDHTQFVTKLDPATGELLWARRVTRHRWDLETGVAVGPRGDVFVFGSLLGERTLFGLTFDTANFKTQAYLVKVAGADGEVVKVRQLKGTSSTFPDDITFSGDRLYVSLSYSGFLEAGNSVTSEQAGVGGIGVLLAYDQDLELERFKYLDVSCGAEGLSPAPDEGVYVRSSSTVRNAWDLGAAGHVVMRSVNSNASAISHVNGQMQLVWTSAIARGSADIAGNGEHLVVAGSYQGSLLMGSGPTAPNTGFRSYMMWLSP